MPTVSVLVDEIAARVGEKYRDPKVLDELCFEFGVELDPPEVVEEEIKRPESHPLYDEAEQGTFKKVFRFDVAANRYDLLCQEGLTRALRVFLGDEKPPRYVAKPAPADGSTKMVVAKEAVSAVRRER